MVGAPTTPAQASIFDRDDRQYVSTEEGSPYSAVGLVTQGFLMRSFTTGFLVDDCHVLTSQGVLGYGQAPLGKRLTFKTGIGTPRQESTKGTVVAGGGFRRNRTAEEQFNRGGRDWVLLRLDQCIGARLGHVILKAGPFSLYEFRNLKSAGFPEHRNKKNGLTIDSSCRIIASRGTVWLNDCATVKGDAGDPIFRISTAGVKPQMEVYAMQSAGFPQRSAVSLRPGYENQAVPMALIAPQIAPYLSSHREGQTGDLTASRSHRTDAIPYVGTSLSLASDRRLLDPSLGTADH
jgi:hypothetical protein